tara:strand:+ start:1980 stop:2399 length:420 start_codon:yes stop_codon:yes gene_type:complete
MTYKAISNSGGEYFFTVTMDEDSNLFVKKIRTPQGYVANEFYQTQTYALPSEIHDYIQTALGQLEDILATSSANGIANFTAQSSVDVSFETAMNNTEYRVLLSIEDFITARITNKSIAGFTIEVGISSYTGTIGYDVMV